MTINSMIIDVIKSVKNLIVRSKFDGDKNRFGDMDIIRAIMYCLNNATTFGVEYEEAKALLELYMLLIIYNDEFAMPESDMFTFINDNINIPTEELINLYPIQVTVNNNTGVGTEGIEVDAYINWIIK